MVCEKLVVDEFYAKRIGNYDDDALDASLSLRLADVCGQATYVSHFTAGLTLVDVPLEAIRTRHDAGRMNVSQRRNPMEQNGAGLQLFMATPQ